MIFFYFLVAGMPLVNQRLFAAFFSDLTTVKYFGAASLVYALVHLALGRDGRFPRSLTLGLFVAFYLVAAASHFRLGLPVPWQLSAFFSLSSFLLLFFIVTAVIDTPQRLHRTLLVAIGAVALGSAYMVREWLEYHNIYKDFRPGWVVGDSNYFTLSALLCLPFMYFLMVGRDAQGIKPPLLERLFLLGTLLLTVAGIGLGASRGGLLGLMAQSGYIVWRSRRRAIFLLLLAAVVLPVLVWAPISSVNRLLHPDFSDVAAENNRLVVWRAGERMIEAHPLGGVGLGNFKPLALQYETGTLRVDSLAHNTYIEVAAELGLPGLILFLCLLGTGFHAAGQARRHTRGARGMLHQVSLGMQAALLGAAVAILFLSATDQKLLWLMLALAPCLASLAAAAANAPSAKPTRRLVAPPPPCPPAAVADARALAEIFR